ncbi:MAG: pyridoxal-dependent decarboxylase, partial [Actinomycetota bacterium]|nr:pyridoxal-dependent decarboxylase [Actinomycetota bacterium]
PFAVLATAGSTSTGSVDDLTGLARLCAEQGLWLHVDAAYGGPARLTAPGRALLAGIERADSLVLDPHKWLFQPYEAGCVLVRHPGVLERAFSLEGAAYLRDAAGGGVDLRNRGLQLSRGSRALKLWLSLRVFGLDAFRAAVTRGIELAEHAERVLRARPGWEVVSPAQLGIVCFRREGPDALNDALVRSALADGFAAPSSTVLDGRTAIRLCTINPRTTFADVEATIERLEGLAAHVPDERFRGMNLATPSARAGGGATMEREPEHNPGEPEFGEHEDEAPHNPGEFEFGDPEATDPEDEEGEEA